MKKQKKVYGIIGLGRFGFALAQRLSQFGAEIMVVDKDESKINQLRDYTENAFIANELDKKSLEAMGFQNCDVVIVCIAEAMDVSILTVMKLMSLGVKKIIAKATSSDHGEVLQKLGAQVIYPEHDMAVRLANSLEMSPGVDLFELSESINVVKVNVPKQFIGMTVEQIDLRRKHGLNIIAIENQGSAADVVLPDYVLCQGDILYLCGKQKTIESFASWLETHV